LIPAGKHLPSDPFDRNREILFRNIATGKERGTFNREAAVRIAQEEAHYTRVAEGAAINAYHKNKGSWIGDLIPLTENYLAGLLERQVESIQTIWDFAGDSITGDLWNKDERLKDVDISQYLVNDLRNLQAENAQAWAGEISGTRKAVHWIHHTTFGIGEFVLGGKGGGLLARGLSRTVTQPMRAAKVSKRLEGATDATKTKALARMKPAQEAHHAKMAHRGHAVATQALLLQHANSHGRRIYEETGDSTLALTAAGVNFLVSNIIFKVAKKPLERSAKAIQRHFTKIDEQTRKLLSTPSTKEQAKILSEFAKGNASPVTTLLMETGGVALSAAGLRTAELYATSFAKDFLAPHTISQTLDLSTARVMDTIFAGLQEGVIIKVAAAVGTAKSSWVVGREMAAKGMTKDSALLLNEAVKITHYHLRISRGLDGTNVKQLKSLLKDLSVHESSSPLFKQLKQALEQQIKHIESGGKTDIVIDSIAKTLEGMPAKDVVKAYREYASILERAVKNIGLEEFTATTEIGQSRNVVERAIRETELELMKTMDKAELDAMPAEKRLQYERDLEVGERVEAFGEQVAGLPLEATAKVIKDKLVELEGKSNVAKDPAEQEAILRERLTYETVWNTLKEIKGESIDAFGRTREQQFEARLGEYKAEVVVVAGGKTTKKELSGKELFDYLKTPDKALTDSQKIERREIVERLAKEIFGDTVAAELLKKAPGAVRKEVTKEIKGSIEAIPQHKKALEAIESIRSFKLEMPDIKPSTIEKAISKINQVFDLMAGVPKAAGELRTGKAIGEMSAPKKFTRSKKRLAEFKDRLAEVEAGLAKNPTDAALLKEKRALKKSIKETSAEVDVARVDAFKKLLTRRGNEVQNWAIEKLDPLLMEIYRAVEKKTPKENVKEKKTLDEAVDSFVEHMGEAYRPLAESVKKIIEKASATDAKNKKDFAEKVKELTEGKGKLDKAEVDLLIETTKLIWGASQARAGIKELVQKAVDIETARAANAEAELIWTGKKTVIDPVAPNRVVKQQNQLWQSIKSLNYGIEGVGRLGDIAEYLSGGNNTRMHKVLYRDVSTGKIKSEDMHNVNLNVLIEKLGDSGLTIQDVIREVDSAPKNTVRNWFSRRRGQPKADRFVSVKFKDGTSYEFTRSELMTYWNNAKDPSTLKQLTSKGATITPSGDAAESVSWSKAKHEATIKHMKDNHPDLIKMAECFYAAMNDVRMTQPLSQYSIKHHGVNIVSGNYWVRERHFTRNEGTIRKMRESAETLDAHAMGTTSYRDFTVLGLSPIGLRTGGKHSIVIRDIYDVFSDYSQSMSNVVHFRDPLNAARRLVGNKELETTLGKHGVQSLLTNLNKNYFDHQVREMTGSGIKKGPAGAALSWAINTVQKAQLSLHPAIMAYQKLSLNAAAVHFGERGGRDILTAEARMKNPADGEFSKSALTREAMENSALYMNRLLGRSALAIAQGTKSASAKKGGIRVGNEFVGGKDFLGMAGINFVDMSAMTAIYGASKIRAERFMRERGYNPKENVAMHRKLTKKLFEENVIETQPMFDPIYQPAMVNAGRTELLNKAVNMFRGYTGKLTAQQRMSIVRMSRAQTPEQFAKALADVTGKTIITSALIPIIRTSIAGLMLSAGSALLGIDEREKTDDELMLEQQKMKSSIASQLLGMTPMGNVITSTIAHKILAPDAYRQDFEVSPALGLWDDLSRTMHSVNSVLSDPNNADTYQYWRMANSSVKTMMQLTGRAQYPFNQINKLIREMELSERHSMQQKRKWF